MKKLILVLSIVTVVFASCDTNLKLNQENAEKTIKEFVSKNSYVTGKEFNMNPNSGEAMGNDGSFSVDAISAIEPLSQFSDNEASCILHFNYRGAYANGSLQLKFNFKRDIDKKWIMTSITSVNGTGGSTMNDKLDAWQNLNIVVQ